MRILSCSLRNKSKYSLDLSIKKLAAQTHPQLGFSKDLFKTLHHASVISKMPLQFRRLRKPEKYRINSAVKKPRLSCLEKTTGVINQVLVV